MINTLIIIGVFAGIIFDKRNEPKFIMQVISLPFVNYFELMIEKNKFEYSRFYSDPERTSDFYFN